eukprot:Lankesteria_metandrocarpae@DN4952_c0_g1_i2.p1
MKSKVIKPKVIKHEAQTQTNTFFAIFPFKQTKMKPLLKGGPRACAIAVVGAAAGSWLVYRAAKRRHQQDTDYHLLNSFSETSNAAIVASGMNVKCILFGAVDTPFKRASALRIYHLTKSLQQLPVNTIACYRSSSVESVGSTASGRDATQDNATGAEEAFNFTLLKGLYKETLCLQPPQESSNAGVAIANTNSRLRLWHSVVSMMLPSSVARMLSRSTEYAFTQDGASVLWSREELDLAERMLGFFKTRSSLVNDADANGDELSHDNFEQEMRRALKGESVVTYDSRDDNVEGQCDPKSVARHILVQLHDESCIMCFVIEPLITSLSSIMRQYNIPLVFKKFDVKKNDIPSGLPLCRGTPSFVLYSSDSHSDELRPVIWEEFRPSEIILKIKEIILPAPSEVSDKLSALDAMTSQRMSLCTRQAELRAQSAALQKTLNDLLDIIVNSNSKRASPHTDTTQRNDVLMSSLSTFINEERQKRNPAQQPETIEDSVKRLGMLQKDVAQDCAAYLDMLKVVANEGMKRFIE